jgi:RNA polymerase sigma-70 factor (ECF subfamily)
MLAEEDGFERFRNYLRILAEASMDPRLKRKIDPSDLVQETLIRAHRARGQLRAQDEAGVAAWLRKILANQLANARRDHLRERRDLRQERSLEAMLARSSAELAALGMTSSSPSGRLERQEALLRLADALAALTEAQREAVLLKHWNGWTLAEIARRQGRTPVAVAGLIHRALKSLREELQGGA